MADFQRYYRLKLDIGGLYNDEGDPLYIAILAWELPADARFRCTQDINNSLDVNGALLNQIEYDIRLLSCAFADPKSKLPDPQPIFPLSQTSDVQIEANAKQTAILKDIFHASAAGTLDGFIEENI